MKCGYLFKACVTLAQVSALFRCHACLKAMSLHVKEMSVYFDSIRSYLASRGKDFKWFKHVVLVFVSYAYQRHVAIVCEHAVSS